jgi:hypothetical protein
MRFKVQLVVCAEDGQEETVHELVVLDKAYHNIEHLGLTLMEAKQLLTTLQHHLLERLKWSLWYGNLYKAFHKIATLVMDLDVAVATTGDAPARKLLKAIEEFHTYIERNRTFIPNDGERYRYGERISTSFVESTVTQVISRRFCKQQQMQWTKRGAHLLLQTRVKTLNQELGSVLQRWYPDMQLEGEPLAA